MTDIRKVLIEIIESDDLVECQELARDLLDELEGLRLSRPEEKRHNDKRKVY